VPWVSSSRRSGRRCRTASISAPAARVSPSDTAWTQNQPEDGAPPVATEALADRLAVKRLGPARATRGVRRRPARSRAAARISQARRAARVRVQRPLPRVDSSRLRPAPA
jgi:hypothetical protein